MFLNMNNVCSLLAFKKVVIIYKKGGEPYKLSVFEVGKGLFSSFFLVYDVLFI